MSRRDASGALAIRLMVPIDLVSCLLTHYGTTHYPSFLDLGVQWRCEDAAKMLQWDALYGERRSRSRKLLTRESHAAWRFSSSLSAHLILKYSLRLLLPQLYILLQHSRQARTIAKAQYDARERQAPFRSRTRHASAASTEEAGTSVIPLLSGLVSGSGRGGSTLLSRYLIRSSCEKS
ncbi:hypothetical protein BCV69DRAFT_78863 [Microstroma glucosiphilum]|uniref:Uncharacterized protein n=1 Tax=Pseudomicrostroma glucosiphilum TaxID=1684307 RepID=A0A316TYT9_9BASI|nr:hypothetical protein BCV69DRAFT_78863 [Pseudomicrostroma glucosiphilum]PWN18220.1 hypothetical protein BCV69DRAFT_78863 [Pseudomicrostroma glucosiphilum]